MLLKIFSYFTSNDEKLRLSVLRDLAEENAKLWQEPRSRGDISSVCSLSCSSLSSLSISSLSSYYHHHHDQDNEDCGRNLVVVDSLTRSVLSPGCDDDDDHHHCSYGHQGQAKTSTAYL